MSYSSSLLSVLFEPISGRCRERFAQLLEGSLDIEKEAIDALYVPQVTELVIQGKLILLVVLEEGTILT